MEDIVNIKYEEAAGHISEAIITTIDAKDLLLQESQTTARDELIINCDKIIAYCDNVYKILEKMRQ
jgi:hypothetical protein